MNNEDIIALADWLSDQFDLENITVADSIREFFDDLSEQKNYNKEHQAEQEEIDDEQDDLTNSQML